MAPLALELRGVSKRFGGLDVLRDVSLALAPGEVRFVIGPNGAGKSTLFKLITGFLRPDRGEILIGGTSVAGMRPHRLRRHGAAQAFQTPRVLADLTVGENLMLALDPYRGRVVGLWRRGYPAQARARAEGVLAELGLAGLIDAPTGALPPGSRKLLDLGTVLIQDPRLILLDEPTAGLTPAEVPVVAAAIRRLRGRAAALIIEHDMGFVRELGESVALLHDGAVARSGPIAELSADPLVRRIYLGHHAGSVP